VHTTEFFLIDCNSTICKFAIFRREAKWELESQKVRTSTQNKGVLKWHYLDVTFDIMINTKTCKYQLRCVQKTGISYSLNSILSVALTIVVSSQVACADLRMTPWCPQLCVDKI